jgi:transposase
VAYGYKGKGVTNHLLVDTMGNPIAVKATAANVSEQDQVIALLQKVEVFIKALIRRGITPILEADKRYDSRMLRVNILVRKIFPWIPYRGEIKKKGIRYLEKARWQVERGISWLQRKFRRLNTRWERKMVYWTGFLSLSLIAFWIQKIGNLLGLCG